MSGKFPVSLGVSSSEAISRVSDLTLDKMVHILRVLVGESLDIELGKM